MLRILLVPPAAVLEEDVLALEFPTVRVSRALPSPALRQIPVSVSGWRSPSFDLWGLDAALDADPQAIQLLAEPGEDVTTDAIRLLSYAQWAIDRRNRASWGARFDPLLERHRLLHDAAKPLACADLRHGLDTWQWVLRLKPSASLALQAAALFHDVERAASEADARVEHLASDAEAWERAHAEAGARIALPLFADVFEDPLMLERACDLIRSHADPRDPETRVLADADALSFLQRGLPVSRMHHGEAHARRKLEAALARLSPEGQARLETLRPLPAVRRQLPRAPMES